MFFPAVTGIAAGANLSGELKDAGNAIPKGTLLAILTTFASYIVYGCSIAASALRFAPGTNGEDGEQLGNGGDGDGGEDLTSAAVAAVAAVAAAVTNSCEASTTSTVTEKCMYGISANQQMMEIMSAWGPLIYAGCFAATLSSALGAFVGGPRVLQAVARDRLFPGISCFSVGWGVNNDPIRGYCVVFVIAIVCVAIGDLNQISGLLSNFFVSAYAIINYAVFHASINQSPGWRPSFKYFNKWVSLLGTVLCIAVMVMMDYVTALITLICIILLYVFVRTRSPNVNWGSSSQSQTFMTALKSVQALAKVEDHVKNYRPKMIVMSGNPADRPPLIDFAHLITRRISLLELVHIVHEDVPICQIKAMKSYVERWLHKSGIKAFYSLTRNLSFCEGVRTSLELSGLGKLSPNMMLIGFQEHWWIQNPSFTQDYVTSLQIAFDLHLAVGVLRVNGGLDLSDISGAHSRVMGQGTPAAAAAVSPRPGVMTALRQQSDLSDSSSCAPTGSARDSGASSLPASDFKIFDVLRSKACSAGSRNSSEIMGSIRDGNPIDDRIISRLSQAGVHQRKLRERFH